MKIQELRKKAEGFTIIEVLIVLAIAGLILLIVFLAVPNLQRNSRNTQIRNDAGNLAGYVNDYAANHNGAIPGVICYDATSGNVGMVPSGACNATTNLAGKLRGGLTVTTGTTNPAGTNTLILGLSHKCNGNTIDSSTTNRAIAVGFKVETASGPIDQCSES